MTGIIIILAGPSWKKEGIKNVFQPVVIVVHPPYEHEHEHEYFHNILTKAVDYASPAPTAIIAYSGSAHVIVPITEDKKTIHHLAGAISQDIMPVKGSFSEAGIIKAIDLLASSGFDHGQIWLLSNGIHKKRKHILNIVKKHGYSLKIINIMQDKGLAAPLTNNLIEQHKNHYLYTECSHYFLIIVLVSFLLMCRKRAFHIWLIAGCITLSGSYPTFVQATQVTPVELANQAWHNKDYENAARLYEKLNSSKGYYNQGNALARSHRFEKAIAAYDKVLKQSSVFEDALYNKNIVIQLLAKQTQLNQSRQQYSSFFSYEGQGLPLTSVENIRKFLKRKLAFEWEKQQKEKRIVP